MSRNLNVAIIGSGFGLRVIKPCLDFVPGITVRAFVSRDPSQLKSELPAEAEVNVYSSIFELEEKESIDIFVIAVPPFMHYQVFSEIKNISPEKIIFIEKPLAHNLKDAQKINDLSMEGCFVDHQMRFHPNIQKIKSIVDSNELGEIEHVELVYVSSTRRNPDTMFNWWSQEELGGGQLLALGSHQIDLLCWLFGEVCSVSGQLKTHIKKRKDKNDVFQNVTSDDSAAFVLNFISGKFAHCFVSSVAYVKDPVFEVVIHGSNAAIKLEGYEKLYISKELGYWEDISEDDELRREDIIGINPWRTSLVRQMQAFTEYFEKRDGFDGASIKEALQTQRIIAAIKHSSKEEKKIYLSDIN